MKQTILTIIVAVLTALVSVWYLTRPQSDFIERVATQVLSGTVAEAPTTWLNETGNVAEMTATGDSE